MGGKSGKAALAPVKAKGGKSSSGRRFSQMDVSSLTREVGGGLGVGLGDVLADGWAY